jgi:hypothetical protein
MLSELPHDRARDLRWTGFVTCVGVTCFGVVIGTT